MIPMVHYYKNMVAIRISFIFKSTVSITNLHIYQYVAICLQTSLNPKHPNSFLMKIFQPWLIKFHVFIASCFCLQISCFSSQQIPQIASWERERDSQKTMRQLRFWQRHSHWQECEDWIPLRAGTTVEARQRRRLLLDIVKTKFCIMYVNLQQPEIYATPRHLLSAKGLRVVSGHTGNFILFPLLTQLSQQNPSISSITTGCNTKNFHPNQCQRLTTNSTR